MQIDVHRFAQTHLDAARFQLDLQFAKSHRRTPTAQPLRRNKEVNNKTDVVANGEVEKKIRRLRSDFSIIRIADFCPIALLVPINSRADNAEQGDLLLTSQLAVGRTQRRFAL